MIVINFVLFKTLLDPEPIIVRRELQPMSPVPMIDCHIRKPEMLSQTAVFRQVLWNFSRLEGSRRITLQQNPHFYVNLPTSVDAYRGDFKALPVENLQLKPNATFYVLVDKPSRIFLEAEQDSRIFSNVFVLKDVMIFKGLPDLSFFISPAFHMSPDIHGVLEGESVVEESIRGMQVLWHGEGPFGFPGPCTETRAHYSHLPPIMATSHWNCQDWRTSCAGS